MTDKGTDPADDSELLDPEKGDEGESATLADDEEVDDTADDDADDAAVRRSFGPWLLVPITIAMVLLCLQHWASVAFGLTGVFAGETYHLYLNGFGSVSTDVADAPPAGGNGPALGGWLVCFCALVLLVAGVLRGLGRFSRPAGITAIVAAAAQIAVVIYSAVVVHSQSGDFYSKTVANARLSSLRVTFSVGWGLWLELLFGFAALAVAVGILVRERNADILRIRL